MFNDSDPRILEKVFRTADITFGGTEAKPTATINVTGRTGGKKFHFVGNGEGRSADLQNNLDPGTTREKDFLEAITDMHADTLTTPLLMSGNTSITDITIPGDIPVELEVQLTRRVVRMDIENDPSVSNFDVKKVLVSNAKLRSYVFGDATGTPPKTIEEKNYAPIEIKPVDPQNSGRLDSVFYLYPTTIGTGKTEIALEGVFNGETKVYNFKPTVDITAVANKRYILKVKKVDINKAEMELTVEEWEDAGDETFEPETDLAIFSPIDYSGVPGIVFGGDETYDLTGVTAAGKLTFTTSSYDARGTTAEVKYNYGSASTYSDLKINNPPVTLTYSALYEQQYEIDIPNIDGSKVPVEMEITIRNGANPDQKKVITLYVNRYADTKLYPVLFGNLYWAPVNVGATEIGSSADVKYMGLLYQWGRNTGFVYGGETGTTSDVYATAGAVDLATATTGAAAGLFIKGDDAAKYDWLSPPDNNLWKGDKQQGPCPDGWRIPTRVELELIKTAYGTGYTANGGAVIWNATEKRIEVKGNNPEETLYFPATSRRNNATGNSYGHGGYGYCWSSDPNGTSATCLSFSWSTLNVGPSTRAYGYPVRCVQDAPQTP